MWRRDPDSRRLSRHSPQSTLQPVPPTHRDGPPEGPMESLISLITLWTRSFRRLSKQLPSSTIRDDPPEVKIRSVDAWFRNYREIIEPWDERTIPVTYYIDYLHRSPMDMKCYLEVNGYAFDNHGNKNEFSESIIFQYVGCDGTIDINCIYDDGFGEVYLKIFIKEIQKEFIFEIMQYNYDTEQFFDQFDLSVVYFDIPDDLNKFTYVVRTCWCSDACYFTCSKEGRSDFMQLMELNKTEFNDDLSKNCTECNICLKEFTINEKLNKLPCEHLFHSECINEWVTTCFEKRMNAKCPCCRMVINPISMEKIDTTQREGIFQFYPPSEDPYLTV